MSRKRYTKVSPHLEPAYALYSGGPMMPAKHQYVSENFSRRIAETRALRDEVPGEFHPLFDHIVRLALHSYQVGQPDRAGIELRQARRLTRFKDTQHSRTR